MDKQLVKKFLEVSKAHPHVVSADAEPLPPLGFPCAAMEIVEFEYMLPNAQGKYEDVRSHRTAAAHIAAKAVCADEYERALEDTPAGRVWLCFKDQTMGIATDRAPDRPIFEVLGDDSRDRNVYDIDEGMHYTGLII